MGIIEEFIKKKALDLGFQKIGITSAETTPDAESKLYSWLNNGFHADMSWIENRKDEKGNILKYFPEAKSVISLGMNYYTEPMMINSQDVSTFKISKYAHGEDYHKLIKGKLIELHKLIQGKLEQDVKGIACVDTSPVMEKVWAQKSGLGWIGKNTMLITRDYGSWLFLGELILDVKLESDLPYGQNNCGTCTACIRACPTQAITENQINSKKCISYLTIEHRGEFQIDFAGKINPWIFGCDICQDVCPWNKKFSKATSEKSFQMRSGLRQMSNRQWVEISEEKFRDLFRQSPVKRTKYSGLRRNIAAAVSQGNSIER